MTHYSWYAKWEMEKEEREESAKEARAAAEAQKIEESKRVVSIESAQPIIKATEQPYKLYEDENGQFSFFERIPKKKKLMPIKDLLFEKEEDENNNF